MPDLKALKTWTKEEINKLRDLLIEISHEIHAHPELGHQEHHAASYLAEILEKEGFAVERATAGLPTAFIAEFSAGTGADIGFLAEYDALPGLGHACGHNLIAASTLGAGIAIKRLLEAGELQGTVKVYGTPAEEGGGGKVTMVEAGLFDGLAAAISMHAGSGTNSVGGSSNAVLPLTFKFKGQPAHAAASPHKGVNALDAVIATFNGINALRQHVTPDVRIHGIITKGGAAANIVPDDCEASFLVRAVSKDGLAEVVEKVKNCAHAGALATGSRLEIVEALQYDDILVCAPLVDMMKANMEDVGLAVEDQTGSSMPASTDLGNVSYAVPTIAGSFAIAPEGMALHTTEFCDASASAEADRATLDAAKAMAMTGLDVMISDEAAADVRQAFKRVKPA